MSVPPLSPSSASSLPFLPPPSAVVARLRAAGCVFAEDEAALLLAGAEGDGEALAASVARRAAGEPLEHVLGWAEFAGHRVKVGPGVFVPRRRTEFLVERAVRLAAAPAVAVDLCCGSGAVGVALLAAWEGVELHAADLDPRAVACARLNLGPAAAVYEGDLYAPLPARLRGRVEVLVANAPYVPTDAVALLPTEARVHEPATALDGGADGLTVLRRVIADAARWLAPGGSLLVESGERQRPALLDALRSGGLTPRVAHCAEREATVLIGRRPDAD
ncbi:release factor glutamine methyltransferase [Streptomyces zhaozhouensis]|uniref:peptide chain release factor N(5)-glutamine methyltransferase n=1 Tax=Streptomyces zhaozhouensis TaxID=1300267 RepID=A0A286E8R2_9ACTN|nr:putative protein N(5)-glutamine methyltransferase [Streptomyces zhaozhouensis]SOD67297.1 release factor glutamine methyltransferase [Streptomyces zhaozhouensis]